MDVDSLLVCRITIIPVCVHPTSKSKVGERTDQYECGFGPGKCSLSNVLEKVRRRHVQIDVSSPRPERHGSNVNQLFHPLQVNIRGVRISGELVPWNAGHSFCKNVDLSLGFPF